MQLVLSNNRIIAHGENFLPMGGVVINTETGARYENATVAECDGCPSDIDTTGYEYHAGEFVPCAPFGMGNNNGYFMEVCESCATPRNSGIPIKGGIKLENLSKEVMDTFGELKLLWVNGSPDSSFAGQTVTFSESFDFDFLIITAAADDCTLSQVVLGTGSIMHIGTIVKNIQRRLVVNITQESVTFGNGEIFSIATGGGGFTNKADSYTLKPMEIYGVKL